MKIPQTGPNHAGADPGLAWLHGERLAWLVVACLLGALVLVRSSVAPEKALLFANPLAFGLFAAFYRLIRIREAGDRS